LVIGDLLIVDLSAQRITLSAFQHLALLATPGVGGKSSGIRESTSHQVINHQVDLGEITTSPDRHITTWRGIAMLQAVD